MWYWQKVLFGVFSLVLPTCCVDWHKASVHRDLSALSYSKILPVSLDIVVQYTLKKLASLCLVLLYYYSSEKAEKGEDCSSAWENKTFISIGSRSSLRITRRLSHTIYLLMDRPACWWAWCMVPLWWYGKLYLNSLLQIQKDAFPSCAPKL